VQRDFPDFGLSVCLEKVVLSSPSKLNLSLAALCLDHLAWHQTLVKQATAREALLNYDLPIL
jgi:hypothetical protein